LQEASRSSACAVGEAERLADLGTVVHITDGTAQSTAYGMHCQYTSG
jgi:hypothetical protein